jgi:diguanylate cyclase (GGDEF)-like protein
MENYDKNFSLIIAQKIIDAVNNSDVIKSLAKGIPVTVTIGCSNYPIDGDTPEGLIDKADKAMYYGKVNGRNQCNCYKREMT